MYTLIILFFILSIVASFLCSVLEAVLLSTTPAFADSQLEENPEIGKELVSYHNNIDRPLSAILTLNTIAHTVGAIGVGAQAAVIWGDSILSTLVIPVVMTLAILILSEIIPKTIGAVHWKKLAGFTVKTLKIIIVVLGPFVVVSQYITKFLMRGESKSVLSRSDFTAMADLGEKEGVINQQESSLMRNFMRFESVRAEDIMTPRTVVIAAQQDETLSDFHQRYPELQFSRIPIYENGIDNITGYILRDDLLAALIDNKDDQPLHSLRRDLDFVVKGYPLTELFNKLLTKHTHITLVVDEFGGTAGVVTMEDVIETLLGLEIVDEADSSVDLQELARNQWQRRAARMGTKTDP